MLTTAKAVIPVNFRPIKWCRSRVLLPTDAGIVMCLTLVHISSGRSYNSWKSISVKPFSFSRIGMSLSLYSLVYHPFSQAFPYFRFYRSKARWFGIMRWRGMRYSAGFCLRLVLRGYWVLYNPVLCRSHKVVDTGPGDPQWLIRLINEPLNSVTS